MRKFTISELVSDLSQEDGLDRRQVSLQLLRNELVGHHWRKQIAVREGVVPVLAQFLLVQGDFGANAEPRDGPLRSKPYHDFATFIQATNIVNILVNGETPYGVLLLVRVANCYCF